MADRIKGITIQLGGDTTGLSKSLKSVNKDINKTQAALKDVNRLLKLDPHNTELMAQKQKLLGQEISQTKDKLKGLKEAEKQVQEQVKEGKTSQEQYDALKREIIATEQELHGLQKEAQTTGNALSRAFDTAADKLGKISDGLGKAAEKTRGLSTAAAAGVAGMAGMVVKAAKSADDINTLAKQSGFGTDTIQQWQYASDRVDVSVDSIIGAAKKMKKNMTSTSKDVQAAWTRLGVAVSDTNGLRNAEDVFNETVKALSRIPNETERDTVAMQLFGKSADELAGIIDDGGAALRAYGQEAKDAGLILSQDALDSANKFNDGLDEVKAKAQAAFFQAGASLAEKLLPHLDDLVDKISQVLEWVASLDGDTLATVGTILAVVAAISPLLSIMQKVVSGVQGVANAIGFLIANPLVALVAAGVALVAAIAIWGDQIQGYLQQLDDYLQGIFARDWTEVLGPVLGEALNAFFANVKNIWDSIKTIFDGIIDFIRGVFTGNWERAWKGVQEIFGGIADGLSALFKAPINNIISMINSVTGAISKIRLPSWMGGKSVNIGKIPYLAKGGVVSQGSAIVGEAGPELLTVANNRTIVQPLGGNTGRIEGLLGDIRGQLGAGSNQPIVVRVELDGRTVAQSTTMYQQRSERAYG